MLENPEDEKPISGTVPQQPIQQGAPVMNTQVFVQQVPGRPVQIFASTPSSSVPSSEDIQNMVQKIHKYLDSINKPGIDFLEFWNAVLGTDGGATPNNIKTAFKMMQMMTGNTITKEILISTGNAYVNELTAVINKETTAKITIKQNLQKQLEQEKSNLVNQAQNLEAQIAKLTIDLSDAKASLLQIDNKYSPQMQEADLTISTGNTALGIVTADINNFIQLIQTNI